jgi:deoxyribonuclease V
VPYVPGFLSFREGPAVVEAFRRLELRPDVLICDGHGRAHPRRLGLASHVGVALGVPTIGVGKSRLVGSHREPSPRRGAATRLVDGNEVIGLVLRTREGVKPVFVSVGHQVELAEAKRLVLHLARPTRLPEPQRRAHHEVSRMRRDARP